MLEEVACSAKYFLWWTVIIFAGWWRRRRARRTVKVELALNLGQVAVIVKV